MVGGISGKVPLPNRQGRGFSGPAAPPGRGRGPAPGRNQNPANLRVLGRACAANGTARSPPEQDGGAASDDCWVQRPFATWCVVLSEVRPAGKTRFVRCSAASVIGPKE